ncbi:hypothetical protein [Cellulomonas hominis]|uniref:hypothetical protein n=1 Tax=Cellulomonas hominis TaxID=156981 RepID=UPI0014445132|nr:hypothetical protein [Cellulomonas hominis]NKY11613.1 hypothetical protein [Cellulomonas hominis]
MSVLGSIVATGADGSAALASFHRVGVVLVGLAVVGAALARALPRPPVAAEVDVPGSPGLS